MAKRQRGGLCPYGTSPAGRQNLFMKYQVYVMQSLKNGDIYIGSTASLQKRIDLHNQGGVKSTKGYRTWQLLEYKEFNSRSEAVKYERFLKTGQQKEILKRKYGQVAKQ